MRDDLVGLPHNPSPPDPDGRPHRMTIYKALNEMDKYLDEIASEYWEYEELFGMEVDLINAIQARLDELRELSERGDASYYR